MNQKTKTPFSKRRKFATESTSTGLRKVPKVRVTWNRSTGADKTGNDKEMKGTRKNGHKIWDKNSEVSERWWWMPTNGHTIWNKISEDSERWWRSLTAPLSKTCFFGSSGSTLLIIGNFRPTGLPGIYLYIYIYIYYYYYYHYRCICKYT